MDLPRTDLERDAAKRFDTGEVPSQFRDVDHRLGCSSATHESMRILPERARKDAPSGNGREGCSPPPLAERAGLAPRWIAPVCPIRAVDDTSSFDDDLCTKPLDGTRTILAKYA